MFEVGEWHLELIICFLDVLKNDFGEVDEAMFLGVDSPCELILYFLGIEKSDLGDSLKCCFKCSNGPVDS
jgi:hypothetical protein